MNIVCVLYKIALFKSRYVFFQNQDDLSLFTSKRLVSKYTSHCLPGSGVNLQKFSPSTIPKKSRYRFLLIARMLWDKGVEEFVDASRIITNRGIDAEFCLLGFLDVRNPSAIPRKQIDAWINEGIVSYLGSLEDVRQEIIKSHCVVLPSYREGTPRSY